MTHVHDDRCAGLSRGAVLRAARDDIDRVGWHVTGVLGDSRRAPFTYTTGLSETFRVPELILAGIDPGVAHQALFNVVAMIRSGNVFKDGDEQAEIVHGYLVRFAAAPGWLPHCTVSRALYGSDPDLLQVVWPDRFGNFPGGERCETAIVHLQHPPADEETDDDD